MTTLGALTPAYLPATVGRAAPQRTGASAVAVDQPIYFQIGVIGVGLRSRFPEVLESYARLYRDCRVPDRPKHTVDVEVIYKRFPPLWRKHYLIRTAGRRKFRTRDPAVVLPYLEWAVNWQIMLLRPEFLQFHASVMQCPDGGGFIFPAKPGSGKTTLAAGLLARGWGYLSDEFALIERGRHRLMPYPKALCIKAGSFPLIQALKLPISDAGAHTKPLKGKVRFLNPLEVRPDAVGSPCPIRAVIFPTYVEGATPKLTPIPRAEAAFELNRQSFNFLEFGGTAIDVLVDVIRSAGCYRLTTGDLNATCDLLEKLAR